MSINNIDKWNPTSTDDIALKKALLTLQKSTDSVLLSPWDQKEEEIQEKRFLLQSTSYFAVKAYVLTGKDFPANDQEFISRFPEKAFKQLLPIDDRIYKETKEVLVRVGSSCRDFYDTKLQNIVKVGSLAVVWSTTTLALLKDNQGLNLYAHLMVLSEVRYKDSSQHDEAFRVALLGARRSLTLLQKEAEDGAKRADDLFKDLQKFQDYTENLRPDTEKLIQKYTAGDKPYLNYLNEQYQKLSELQRPRLEQFKRIHDEWKALGGEAIGDGVGGLQQEAFKSLWEEYETLKRDNADEAILIESINNLGNQFKGLKEKIHEAIKAVGVLSLMFNQQSDSYKLIVQSLSGMSHMANEEDAETRRLFIKSQIGPTCLRLNELQKAAAGFVTAILTENNLG
ncbi:hypothetical protein PFICI_10686 [Pestalotiopsis fici W106-1]|uniref:Uncharacterized protein n=1 Tax=Pestalotiopsis fici (strain W106-1 / CGMCC3.15140) TaxID=1229662 RepID=W3WXV4_PESFW|nr:uncharacterized protein PFICI_10686 [Pestalotiopsis fici W106-1]ETS78624.1 hypothetical protein PFICI_10686 [Pestalotiopsis fici W106-1]